MARLTGAKLDLDVLCAEASRLLAKALPHDTACWHTMDPATLIETSYFGRDMPRPTAEVAEFAYLSSDYNSFAKLATAKRHSGVLSEATGGRLDRSPRYRELLRPNNMSGELRSSFVVDGAAWGCVTFFRAAPVDFTEAERDFADDIAPLLGKAFRTAGTRARNTGDLAMVWPGMVLLGVDRRVESVTAPARTWLDDLGFDGVELPFGLLTAAERVRETSADVTALVAGVSGRWIQVHASPALGGGPGRVVIILQAASSPSIAPMISATYGLTARERELVELVLQGCHTKEIAERLFISPYTVQGHLKSIFAKTGVRSRRELVGRVFVRHDQPLA
jgi:DNA-binding CsgD family transcriptional regulator